MSFQCFLTLISLFTKGTFQSSFSGKISGSTKPRVPSQDSPGTTSRHMATVDSWEEGEDGWSDKVALGVTVGHSGFRTEFPGHDSLPTQLLLNGQLTRLSPHIVHYVGLWP